MKDFLARPWVVVGAWFIAAVAFMLGPVFGGLVLFPPDSDLIVYYYPLFAFYSEALHAGESFLWLPHIYSGFPVYLSQVAGFLDPVNLFIFSIFSGIDGMHVRLALGFFLALVCSYMAVRTSIAMRAQTRQILEEFLVFLPRPTARLCSAWWFLNRLTSFFPRVSYSAGW